MEDVIRKTSSELIKHTIHFKNQVPLEEDTISSATATCTKWTIGHSGTQSNGNEILSSTTLTPVAEVSQTQSVQLDLLGGTNNTMYKIVVTANWENGAVTQTSLGVRVVDL